MLEKTEDAFKNVKSRNNGNIGYIRHRTKTSKTKKAKQKAKIGK